MKKLLIAFLTMITVIKSTAQTNETLVNGSSVNTKNQAVEFATIALMKSKDSAVLKIGISDKEGAYTDFFTF